MNREFIVTYNICIDEIYDDRVDRFRTMKEFSDWFNAIKEPVIIFSIVETNGPKVYDKYYKKGDNK